ncbi:MAG: hypothetical protein CMI18_13725 [Opitutaceae bacterium]|nr:hypothetical protein [Opitutaceae bacterium]
MTYLRGGIVYKLDRKLGIIPNLPRTPLWFSENYEILAYHVPRVVRTPALNRFLSQASVFEG